MTTQTKAKTKAKKYRAFGEFILVQLDPEMTKSAGGILLPEKARPKTTTGEVVSVGPEVKGEMQIQPGDIIHFNEYATMDIDKDNRIIAIKQDMVFAVECEED